MNSIKILHRGGSSKLIEWGSYRVKGRQLIETWSCRRLIQWCWCWTSAAATTLKLIPLIPEVQTGSGG